jgi:hypothetical protein
MGERNEAVVLAGRPQAERLVGKAPAIFWLLHPLPTAFSGEECAVGRDLSHLSYAF